MQNDFGPYRPLKPAAKLKQTPPTDTNIEPNLPFETPQQVSLQDDARPRVMASVTPAFGSLAVPSPHHKFHLQWPPSRKQIIIASVALVVVIALIGSFLLFRPKPAAPAAAKVEPAQQAAPQPVTAPSSLSGMAVAPEVNQRPVVGVMIENSKVARPQAGLSEAGVVFEAIAEGGITRFLALFQDQQPGNVGPIRSARPYYVQWNESFRAAYTHMGGSADALSNIKSWGVQTLGSNGTRRVSDKASPHNVYANVGELANIATSKGFKSEFTPLARKAASPAKQPTATAIALNISSSLYNVNYTYDGASNSYLRTLAGAPHTDANTGKQLSPSVVVALAVPMSSGGRTSQGGAYSVYNVVGSGQAVVFQDGVATTVNWQKADNRSQISFTDAAGAPFALNPGQTWFSAVTGVNKVTYQ